MVDTVKNADKTPDLQQPYRELGMNDDEYARIREILGRRLSKFSLGKRKRVFPFQKMGGCGRDGSHPGLIPAGGDHYLVVPEEAFVTLMVGRVTSIGIPT